MGAAGRDLDLMQHWRLDRYYAARLQWVGFAENMLARP